MSTPTTALQRGVTLVELLLAVAISAILLAALSDLVKLGLDAQASVRGSNELSYQGRFALERITNVATGIAPKPLTTPDPATTGNWFSTSTLPCGGVTCLKYCLNASQQLIETTTSDSACSGSKVIAANVTAFAATLPAGQGPVDRPVAVLSLSLANGGSTLTLSSSVRLGGGIQ